MKVYGYKNQRDMQDCIYSEGVACDDRANCYKCGWNPKVAAERSAEILERIENGGEEAESGEAEQINHDIDG